MSESLLTLPAENEATVVQRFTEASKELIPGMQISLARRIVRPGSDQVLCLNATTSVPMQDDEIASVSDLALKLSDGTNVRISLSFFNDGNECPGFNHEQTPLVRPVQKGNPGRKQSAYSFDPERYSMHSVKNETQGQSSITPAMLIASTIAILGLYASINGPASFNSLCATLKKATVCPPKAVTTIKTTETTSKVKPAERGAVMTSATNNQSPPKPLTPAPTPLHGKMTRPSAKNNSLNTAKTAVKTHNSGERISNNFAPPPMMVPPPPVTYTISPAQLFTPAEIAAMQPMPASAKTPIHSGSRVEKAISPEKAVNTVKAQTATQGTTVTEKPANKLPSQAPSASFPEFDDENAVAPNAGLNMFPSSSTEHNNP